MKTAALWCAMALVGAGQAAAQDYPSKPVRIHVGGAGGGGDISARLVGSRLSGLLGQQVVVENHATVLVADVVAKSPADGYNLLMDATSLWTNPILQPMPYDVIRDFAAVSTTDRASSILVVHPSVPVTTVKELIALARAKPGELNWGTGQPGTLGQLGAELFKSMAGINIVRVPYKSTAAAMTATIGGEVQIYLNAGAVLPLIKAGKLKALAIASAGPSSVVPDLPTVSESGLPGYEATLVQGILAPIKTPQPILRRLNQEIVRALSVADIKEKYLAVGSEGVSSTPEEFTAIIKADMAKWGRVIKESGISAQ